MIFLPTPLPYSHVDPTLQSWSFVDISKFRYFDMSKLIYELAYIGGFSLRYIVFFTFRYIDFLYFDTSIFYTSIYRKKYNFDTSKFWYFDDSIYRFFQCNTISNTSPFCHWLTLHLLPYPGSWGRHPSRPTGKKPVLPRNGRNPPDRKIPPRE